MPTLQRVKQQAKAVACQSNLRQWGSYFLLYTDDNNGHFHREPGNGEKGYEFTWMSVMRPYYLDAPDICFCPTATKHHDTGGRRTFTAWRYHRSNVLLASGSYGINLAVKDQPPTALGRTPAADFVEKPLDKKSDVPAL